jgi:ABC-2 type transport system ATP-binding protein
VPAPAIETHELVRTFRPRKQRPVTALAGVTLEVPRGELFGLLGPNGAGKTTLIKILVTLLLPSAGVARVAGFDVAGEPHEVRRRIAMVSGGETTGFGLLTVAEQLWMFAQFHGIPSKEAKRRIGELLEVVGLGPRRSTRVSDLSTGMRQRLNLARGFLTEPQVLFLDEPTVGLDVGAARDLRRYVRRWTAEGPARTVLLTTHYLKEAEDLCDRVAIIDGGAILACDSPDRLRRSSVGTRYAVRTEAVPAGPWRDGVPGLRWAEVGREEGGTATVVTAELGPDGDIAALVAALAGAAGRVLAVAPVEPSLEDVFVKILDSSVDREVDGATEVDVR